MDRLSNRQQAILDHLLYVNEYVPASQLGALFNISEKTIYREIQILREKGYSEVILHTTGKGFKVDYQYYTEFNISKLPNKRIHFSIEDRREKILLNLLINSPKTISITQLSNKYYISNTSIFNDLKYIGSLLEGVDLTLNKNNKGTAILGDEKLIREVLKNCVIKIIVQTNEYDLDNIEKMTLLFLQEYFSCSDISFAKKLILYLRNNGMLIEEPYDINLLTYIIISIYRIRQQQFLTSAFDKSTVEFHVKELAMELKKEMENYLGFAIPHSEFVGIYNILISSRCNELNNDKNDLQDKSSIFIDLLIDQVVKESHFKNFKNGDLKPLLYPHVKYLLRRLEYGISIHNPLLEQIKKEFSLLFTIIEKSLHNLYLLGMVQDIDENEVGYLTLYFQHILEQYLQKLRVIIVCSTGIGTSHLLKNRVMHAFPKWEIVSLMNLSKLMKRKDFSKVDLILSTIKLEHAQFSVPVINVSVFFNKNDLNNVQKIVNTLAKNEMLSDFEFAKN